MYFSILDKACSLYRARIFFKDLANWSGQLVPRALQSIPSRRSITSWIFIPAQSEATPWGFPWQPFVYRTLRTTSPSVSMSICYEHTAGQVRKDVLRTVPSMVSWMSVTSNIV